MTRLILHVGMHKTGTTSIQGALYRSEGQELLYPTAGREHSKSVLPAHHHLARSVVSRYTVEHLCQQRHNLWGQLRAEIDSKRPALAVISSELFWPAKMDDVEQIAGYLNGLDVQVVFYVRNQWAYMVSSFKQHIKMGATISFRQMMEKKLWMLDYDRHIQRWAEYFTVHVRLYDKVKDALVDDFSRVISHSIVGVPLKRNVSPDDVTMQLVWMLNILKRKLSIRDGSIVDVVQANLIGGRNPGRWIAAAVRMIWHRPIGTSSDKEWLREATSDMRIRFLEQHVQKEDWHFFNF